MSSKRSKHKPKGSGKSPHHSITLTKGDWLDVMDCDGIWTVARVLSVPSAEEVEVTYDGWPAEYNEVVRVDSERVAPYHTFTWAVRCWVKYLNWPMWPSVITIRTPGTREGITNLALENQLFVDFLDDSNFGRRDRCWQPKRQIREWGDNYENKRMRTCGGQFERALLYAMQSDATTILPTFTRGTLPDQYKNSTTESVHETRRSMGNGLWFRSFADNKDRHYKTHKYETIGNIKMNVVDTTDDVAHSVAKMDLRNSRKKKKHPKRTHRSMKVDDDSPLKAEEPYVLEISSSDDSCSESDQAARFKRRRLDTNARSPVSRKKKQDIATTANIAGTLARHVTVIMDQIIVDDDEDDGDSESSRGSRRKTRKKKPRPSTKKRVGADESENNEEWSEERVESVSESSGSRSTSCSPQLTPKADRSSSSKRVRRTKAKGAGVLHSQAWTSLFKENERNDYNTEKSDGALSDPQQGHENDNDNVLSDSFDPETTSEDKTASSLDSWMDNLQARPGSTARSETKHKATLRKVKSTKPKKTKATNKMAARRSNPDMQEYVRASIISDIQALDPVSNNEEEDSVDDAMHPVDRENNLHLPQTRKRSREEPPRGNSRSKPMKTTPKALVDQKVAAAQDAMRELSEAKEKESEAKATEVRMRLRNHRISSTYSDSPGHKTSTEREFLKRMAGKVKETPSVGSRRQNHSFISVNAPCSSDSDESKSVLLSPKESQSFGILSDDDDMESADPKIARTLDFLSEEEETKSYEKAETKSVSRSPVISRKLSSPSEPKRSEFPEESEDDESEEKSQEPRQRYCMMRAGKEDGEVEMANIHDRVKCRKRTTWSASQKFVTTNKPRSRDLAGTNICNEDDPALSVFSSSKGFTMESWFKGGLNAGHEM